MELSTLATSTVVGLVLADIAAAEDVPIYHYAATIAVLGAIYGVVKAVLMVLRWLDEKINDRLASHHKDTVAAIEKSLKKLPCQRPSTICVEEEGKDD